MYFTRKILSSITLTIAILGLTANIALAAPILKMDSHGHDVLVLQQRLQKLGYKIKTIDGLFGNEVYRAVIAFQRDNKLTINGIVDSKTWNSIKKASDREDPPKEKTDEPKKSDDDSDDEKATAKVTDTKPTRTVKTPENKPFVDRGKVKSIIASAKKQIGVPYVFGGTTPKGFDCSGFLQYVFAQNGFKIPRLADSQYSLGIKVKSKSLLEAGDLVFFNTDGTGVSHCGIYLGNNQFIHASSSKGIRIDSLNDSYWKPRYYGGKHIII